MKNVKGIEKNYNQIVFLFTIQNLNLVVNGFFYYEDIRWREEIIL